MHLISLLDWDAETIRRLLDLAHSLKRAAAEDAVEPTLRGKVLALLFEKASMRTRVSFEVAVTQLGGHVTYLAREDVNLGQREPVRDGARALSRYVDGIAARVYSHQMLQELAAHATVPVINALSDVAHPCQALADLLTIEEHFEDLSEVKVAFIGDANNVARSLASACAKLAAHFTIASPAEHRFPTEFVSELSEVASETGGSISVTGSFTEAAEGAHVLYTDVWVSMGQQEEREERLSHFAGFSVDEQLVERASDEAVVMHCLPAHRGEEITDAVIEGPHSVVFDQAENRLHAQRALLQMLLGPSA